MSRRSARAAVMAWLDSIDWSAATEAPSIVGLNDRDGDGLESLPRLRFRMGDYDREADQAATVLTSDSEPMVRQLGSVAHRAMFQLDARTEAECEELEDIFEAAFYNGALDDANNVDDYRHLSLTGSHDGQSHYVAVSIGDGQINQRPGSEADTHLRGLWRLTWPAELTYPWLVTRSTDLGLLDIRTTEAGDFDGAVPPDTYEIPDA